MLEQRLSQSRKYGTGTAVARPTCASSRTVRLSMRFGAVQVTTIKVGSRESKLARLQAEQARGFSRNSSRRSCCVCSTISQSQQQADVAVLLHGCCRCSCC
jgi:hypothetical protein